MESKSPAWQAVMKYAEMTDDPSEVLPFIQGIKNIESVAALDPKQIDQAEKIVRLRLQHRGDTDEVIEEQIEALKTTDKLISTAEKVKPILENEEKRNLQQMVQEQRRREEEYGILVKDIQEKAITAIQSPIFGKQKLKKEEMAAIYDLIGEPDEQTKGYLIYSKIDELFEKRDFETLRLIALTLANKESMIDYAKGAGASEAAAGLQRKLRVATEGRSAGGKDLELDEDTPIIQRNQYSPQPRFGR
jgi:hypothetical protein